MNDWPVMLKLADAPEPPSPELAAREHLEILRAAGRDAHALVVLLAAPVADYPRLLSRVQGRAIEIAEQLAQAEASGERLAMAKRAAGEFSSDFTALGARP